MNNAFRVLFETHVVHPSHREPASPMVTQWTRPFPSPAKEGYIFSGLYQEPDCTNRWNFAASVPGDITLSVCQMDKESDNIPHRTADNQSHRKKNHK